MFSEDGWEKRWVKSDWKEDDNTAGEWSHTAGNWSGDANDKGIHPSFSTSDSDSLVLVLFMLSLVAMITLSQVFRLARTTDSTPFQLSSPSSATRTRPLCSNSLSSTSRSLTVVVDT